MSANAKEACAATLADIVKLIKKLHNARTEKARGKILDELYEYPLDISVRSGWQAAGEMLTPAEYQILLAWGGPAIRITGDLDEHGEPANAILEYQDWFEPWQTYPLSSEEEATLVDFARAFPFN